MVDPFAPFAALDMCSLATHIIVVARIIPVVFSMDPRITAFAILILIFI